MGVKVNVISTPKNRVSINKQDRKSIRSVGIIPPVPFYDPNSSVAFNQANAAYVQANVGTTIAVSAFVFANGVSANAITQLIGLTDVDASDVDNNETLIYDNTSGKFVVKEIPIINGGTF